MILKCGCVTNQQFSCSGSRPAKLTANSIVHASKKGVVLLMRKMDKLSMRPTEDPAVADADATVADQGLVVFFLDLDRSRRSIQLLFSRPLPTGVCSL
jgi:hypothetical protein